MLCGLLALVLSAPLDHRWFYLATNFLVDTNVDSAVALLARAHKAGYNGAVVTDSKFCRWDQLPPRYLDNVRRFRKAAKEQGIKVFACVAPIGYSNDLLARDPDLAEGLPVVEAPFTAQPDGTLTPDPSEEVLKNPGFEESRGEAPAGLSWVDQPGKVCVLDHDVKSEGSTSLRMQDAQGGNARACQTLDVKPFQYLHLRLDVKTQDLEAPGNVNVLVLGKTGQSLQHRTLPIKRTMDWTALDLTFNTLDNTSVNLYVGVWGMRGGHIWWDNLRLEQGGLVNLVRRPGAPFKLTSADTKTTFVEGKDYDGARDPKCGNVAWPGDYDFWHTPPVLTFGKLSRIRAGDKVLASYCHTALVYDGQVTVCLGEPKVMELVKWQIAQVHKFLQPDGYFLSHDEIRVGGWDAGCTRAGKSPGQLLADNVRACSAAVRLEDPGKPVFVWSDMFDPFHNAAEKGFYYLLKGDGPWKGSWEGLDKDVVVVNWNMQEGKRQESLDFFRKLGHGQVLAGYYDGGGVPVGQWIREAGHPAGVMYTTWQAKYDDLEAFARQAGFPRGG